MTAAIRAPHPARPALHPAPPARPHLRVIPGGREAALRRRQPAAVYRRRRWVVAAVAVAGLVGLLLAARAVERRLLDEPSVAATPAAATAAPSAPAPSDARPLVRVVQPGDTAWSIARELQPTGDVRPLVDEVVERAGGSLRAGQRLDLTGLAP